MPTQKKVNIVLLETSDIHGNVLPINYGTNKKAELGLAKVATVIQTERKNNEHVIVIDNGDLIQGTPLTYHYVKFLHEMENPMVKLLNHLQYDGFIIGNHEFNYGLSPLEKAFETSTFPWLSANIINENNNKPTFGNPYFIKHVGAIKVAVLGITTHYIPNWEDPQHIQGLQFADAFETTKWWVNYIHEHEKPDVMVVSYHGGFERDLETGEPTENLTGENQGYAICKQISGIDVLLTGHQHRKIATTIDDVTVIQPSVNGEVVGKVTLELIYEQDKWIIENKKAELLSVEHVSPNKEVLDIVHEYESKTQTWLDQAIGTIQGDMTITNVFEARLQDHPFVEFINKVQMDAAGVTISNTALFNNNATGFQSHVTMRDIVSNYIYPNTLKVLRLKGQDIKDALERSASYFQLNHDGEIEINPAFTTPKPQHYNYDMWEGIEYVLDISKPIGERVILLQYNDNELDLTESFDVVMNNYRASGGGDYTMFQNKPVIKDIPIDMSELLASYFLSNKTIHACSNGNWKVIW